MNRQLARADESKEYDWKNELDRAKKAIEHIPAKYLADAKKQLEDIKESIHKFLGMIE
ncbi:hypothetical protein [Dryocola sp. BD586]|uniref:hypothetical protein n=1 Tax=Dryocola sp. BD586 TaxID=3133271 RepID=UPI003F504DF0